MALESNFNSSEYPLIPEYFANKEVFITGATGFIGSVLVERMLWTCSKISRLHLLIRHKKEVTPEQRLQKLKESPLFDVIKKNCPERLEKLVMVAGDITKPNFNIEREALQGLNQVSIVLHAAASVNFNEPLDKAVEMNFRSTLTLMDLCDQLPRIEALVYVSTAYSNAELSTIEERVYPAEFTSRQFLALVDNLPPHILAKLSPTLISPKPNTYTFTKAMAESALAERARACTYATAIVRPSVVVSTLQHPFPGWISSYNGSAGYMIYIGKGLIHVFPCVGSARFDSIPVDMAVDTLIAATWEVGTNNYRESRVYNCSSYDNPTTYKQFIERIVRGVREHPFDATLWYPFVFITTNTLLLNILGFLFHTMPQYIMEFPCAIARRQSADDIPLRRMQAMVDSTKFFLLNDWKLNTNNTKRLRDRLTAADAAIFNIDPQTIDWNRHCTDFIKGLRKHLLRESDKDVKKAHSRMRIMHIIHGATQCLIALAVYHLVHYSVQAVSCDHPER